MIPGNGDHIANRKVKGGTYVVISRTRKHLRVRCLETGVPALIRRNELDRWVIVFSPKDEGLNGPGLEGLRKNGRFYTRVDAPKRSRSRA